ncbi:MAG: glycerate kinase type-2 family protein [Fervidicoccaceae archaeon]
MSLYESGKKLPSKLSALLEHALKSLDIGKIMEQRIDYNGREIIIRDTRGKVVGKHELGRGKIKLIAFGKASQSMALTMLKILEGRFDEGVVIFPRDQPVVLEAKGNISVIPSTHPVPSESSLEAARRVREMLSGLSEEDNVIFLISGGGSSLLEEPIPPVSLDELVKTYKLLLNSGADIREINTVRKHISQVKGGRLAQQAYPAQVISLIASDVPGNDISFVASGPTVPDHTTYQDAYNILEFYELLGEVPESVLSTIKSGMLGKIPETPKEDSPIFSKVRNYLIASPYDLALSVKEKAEALGLNAYLLTTRVEGESSEVAKVFSSIALDVKSGLSSLSKPTAIIVAGETSVKVRGSGKGGRAIELAAWFAREISGTEGISMFAIDTDGKDGSSDAAGAFATGETWEELKKLFGRRIIDMLRNNDSFSLLDSGGYTIRTGPTGSNLNNLICILVE